MAPTPQSKLPKSAPPSTIKIVQKISHQQSPSRTPKKRRRASTTDFPSDVVARPPEVIRNSTAPSSMPSNSSNEPSIAIFSPTQDARNTGMATERRDIARLGQGIDQGPQNAIQYPNITVLNDHAESQEKLKPTTPRKPIKSSKVSPISRGSESVEGQISEEFTYSSTDDERAQSNPDEQSTPTQSTTGEQNTEHGLTPGDINDMVHIRIRGGVAISSSREVGLVYVSEVIGRKGFYKIGSTKNTALERGRQIKAKCGLRLSVKHRSNTRMIYPIQAEKISQDELTFFQEKFICPRCGTEHGEYFRLPLKKIENTVLRWENFILQEPYETDGSLSAFWAQRLKKHPNPPEVEKHDDHTQRGKRWANFIYATTLDRHIFQTFSTWTWIRTNYRSFEFWKTPTCCFWMISLMLMWYDGALQGRLGSFKIMIEILQALPLFLVSSKVSELRRKASRQRS